MASQTETKAEAPPKVELDLTRQHDLCSAQDMEGLRVTVIGAGAIGGMTTLFLSKMGVPEVEVWDPDTVEEHNVPNQMFGPNFIGMSKVEGLQVVCENLVGATIKTHAEEYIAQELKGVVISAVDSMKAREAIWKAVIAQRGDIPLYIDARMGGLAGWVQGIVPDNPTHRLEYEATLYSDEEAQEEPCTARAIIYNTGRIASTIADNVRRYVKGLPVPAGVVFTLATDEPAEVVSLRAVKEEVK